MYRNNIFVCVHTDSTLTLTLNYYIEKLTKDDAPPESPITATPLCLEVNFLNNKYIGMCRRSSEISF